MNFKSNSLGALIVLILTIGASAQTDVKTYLADTDPILIKIVELNTAFKQELQPLRESKDLVGISNAVDKYDANWKALRVRLEKIQPPADAKAYHAAIDRLLGIQAESNALLTETIAKGIEVAKEVQALKDSGASDAEVAARITEFTKGRGSLEKKIMKLKNEAISLDSTLQSERKKLDAE